MSLPAPPRIVTGIVTWWETPDLVVTAVGIDFEGADLDRLADQLVRFSGGFSQTVPPTSSGTLESIT